MCYQHLDLSYNLEVEQRKRHLTLTPNCSGMALAAFEVNANFCSRTVLVAFEVTFNSCRGPVLVAFEDNADCYSGTALAAFEVWLQLV